MKKKAHLLLIAITILSLLACSSCSSAPSGSVSFDKTKISNETVSGNTQFAFDIFRHLNKEDNGQSIFISPISISTALTMTYQGAGTTTKEAMAKALGYTGIDDVKLNDSYRNLLRYLKQADKKIELNISNSLWIREGQAIKEPFLTANKDIFDASVTSLDFSKADAADQINKWISDATKKKIEKMIDSPIASDVIMYLINAIYFRGDWTYKFDKKNTVSTPFHSGDGSTGEAMLMSMKGKIGYGQGDSFKAVRLPYGSGKTAMYCILPDEATSIGDFVAELDSAQWKVIKESISEKEDVQLRLPRFKLEYGIKNLNDSLTALGMGEAFSDTADFTGIRESVCISRVLHKAVIEVDETGSKAAAVTVVEIKETAAAEPLTFIADRPFIFIIADDETGTILFMGKLYNIK